MQTHFMVEEIYLIFVEKFTGYEKHFHVLLFDPHDNSLLRDVGQV